MVQVRWTGAGGPGIHPRREDLAHGALLLAMGHTHFDDFMAPFGPQDRAPLLPLLGTGEFMEILREAAGDSEIVVPETYKTLEF